MKYLGAPQSGSQANTTASRNRYGQYYRNRARPVNPRTPAQTSTRAALSEVSQRWQTLSSTEQASWVAYANAHPVLDRLGSSIILSGNAWFVKFNVPNILFGSGIVTTPPASPTPGARPIFTPTYDTGTPTFEVAYTPDPSAGTRTDIFAGGPRSAGVQFDNNLRFIYTIADGDASPANILAAYTAKWGTALAGQKVFLQFKTYDNNNNLLQTINQTVITT